MAARSPPRVPASRASIAHGMEPRTQPDACLAARVVARGGCWMPSVGRGQLPYHHESVSPDSAPQTSPGRPSSWRTAASGIGSANERERLGRRVEADDRVRAEVGQPDDVLVVDEDRVGLRPRRPGAATPATRRSPGRSMPSWPASHSATQSRPCESDQTRRAPWPGVGGSIDLSPPRSGDRSARCGCRPATRTRPRRRASP